MKKAIIMSLAFLLIAMQLTGCGASGECKAVVEKFETACNELDVNGILDCMNPTVAEPIKTGLNFLSGIVQQGSQELMDLIGNALLSSEQTEGEDVDASEMFGSMDIEVKNCKVDKDTAVVQAEITFNAFGKEITKQAELDMIQKEEAWYIDGFRFVDATE